MTPTNQSLKQALARMLPKKLYVEFTDMDSTEPQFYALVWKELKAWPQVLDTELLQICWEIEEELSNVDKSIYAVQLRRLLDFHRHSYFDVAHATWQQRTIALAQVKGIEI